jgi:hypothetical protein
MVKVELETRFARVARSRAVSVTVEPQDSILFQDYSVRFEAPTNSFQVTLRRGGCFEHAYRCIERFIEAKAEELDGINSIPAGHVDLRGERQYWMLEQVYDQFRIDLDSAIPDKLSSLDHSPPEQNVLDQVGIEMRMRALHGLIAYLNDADREVRRGVLSPKTVQLLKSIGLDVCGESRLTSA